MCDIGSLLIGIIEITYINHNDWIFNDNLCPIYLGSESFTSSALYYFVIALNLHTISTCVLHLKLKRIERERADEENTRALESGTETDESTDDDGIHKRQIVIDYTRKKSHQVSIFWPICFIWMLAISISIPNFIFGETTMGNTELFSCRLSIRDSDNIRLMDFLTLIIRFLIPTIYLFLTLITLIFFICSTDFKRTGRNGNKKLKLVTNYGMKENTISLLKLSMFISISYIMFSLYKMNGSVKWFYDILHKFDSYRLMKERTKIILCMVSNVGPIIRAFIYLTIGRLKQ